MDEILRWLAEWRGIQPEPGAELQFEFANFPTGGLGMLVLIGIALAVVGELRLGDERLVFAEGDSYLLMDDHKGYYPWIMRWDWVTGGGVDDRGRRVGFNLTRNDSIDPARYNENCLWLDGKRHLLPPVRFARRPDRSPEIWEVRDEAGEVEVDFVIELDGYVRVNAVIVESRYRGPFGHVRGTLRGPGGERVGLDGMFGMGEDFYLRC